MIPEQQPRTIAVMPNVVSILGGGVAGLSAAHELAERGFKVHIYERKGVLGGKARSIPVPNSGTAGRAPLPGEHGFRFFPGFYKHITDTMRRTPYGAHGNTFDNLSVATRILLARAGQRARSPGSPEVRQRSRTSEWCCSSSSRRSACRRMK